MSAVTPCDAVVLNWRDPDSTRACIDTLLAEPEVRRVWIVDNESDGTLERQLSGDYVGTTARVRVLAMTDNLGFSAGVNRGLSAALDAGAGSILVVNNDAQILPGTTRVLLEAMLRSGDLGAVAPVIYDEAGTRNAAGGGFRPVALSTSDIQPHAPDYLTWATVLLRASTLRQVGLLSERFFMYWEDVEFGLRLRDAGIPMRVVSEGGVIHQVGASHVRAGPRVIEYSSYGAVTLARARPGLTIKIGAVFRICKRLVGYTLTRDWARVTAVAHGAWTAVVHSGPATKRYPRSD